jgi:16S rRNA (guanine527-N7)-methyltransferase
MSAPTGSVDAPQDDASLIRVLERSRELGFLGPGPVEFHVEHARAFVGLVSAGRRVLDLGSGGGLPGLVLLHACPQLERLVLLDAMERRGDFLRWAVAELRAPSTVQVVTSRAEPAARTTDLRGQFDIVVARSFGRPAVTAECSVGFLEGPGARLLVSEPPEPDVGRWPDAGLTTLGLRAEQRHEGAAGTIQELVLVEHPSDAWPRRDGVPAKRPLF